MQSGIFVLTLKKNLSCSPVQQTLTCSKSAMDTPEQCVKSAES